MSRLFELSVLQRNRIWNDTHEWHEWMYEMQIKFIKVPQKFISHAMFCPSAGCQRLSPVDFNPGTNSLAKLPKRKFIFQAPIFRCELLGLGNVYTCNLPYTTIYNLQSISWWKKMKKTSKTIPKIRWWKTRRLFPLTNSQDSMDFVMPTQPTTNLNCRPSERHTYHSWQLVH